jgi:hypothetical protein
MQKDFFPTMSFKFLVPREGIGNLVSDPHIANYDAYVKLLIWELWFYSLFFLFQLWKSAERWAL